MLTVSFAPNELGPGLEVDASAGEPLVDVCDAASAPVSFSCRAGTCGTCRLEVLSGASLLEAPERAERDLLEIFGAPPSHRLACQARLSPGVVSGKLELRWVPEYE